jgi:hypothetical protein
MDELPAGNEVVETADKWHNKAVADWMLDTGYWLLDASYSNQQLESNI